MIEACVKQLVEKGELSAAQAALYTDTYKEIAGSLKGSMASAAAAAKATDETMKAMQARIIQRKRIAGLTYANRRQLVEAVQRATDEGTPLTKAVQGLYAHDERMRGSSLEGTYDAVRGTAQGMMADLVERFERTVTGTVAHAADLLDVLRAARGEAVDNVTARNFAKAWGETAEYLRQRFNAAGGQIRRLENWGMPQMHDAERMFKAGFEAWRAHVLPRLDIAKMVDWESGLPLSGKRLNAMLKDAYDGIVTGGWDDRTLTARGAGALAKGRQQSRFLIFRDTDSWIEYQAEYGMGDVREHPTMIFEAMIGHIDEMARDIAAMEMLGPDPAATHKWLKNMVEKGAATGSVKGKTRTGIFDAAATTQKRMDNMWANYTGAASTPGSARAARLWSTMRQFTVATDLGGATLTAASDTAFSMATRMANGMPATRALTEQVMWMLPGLRNEDRAIARHVGLMNDELAARLAPTFRDVGEMHAHSWASRLGAGVLKASLLTRWTQAVKWAFGMDFMGHMGRQTGHAYDALPAATRLGFERYGITPADWDMIRSTALFEHRGAQLLRPDEIRKNPAIPAADRERLAHRFLEMLQTETRYVSPEPNLRARAAINQGLQPGTIPGEVARSFMQFKGFSTSVMLMHGNRMLHGRTAISRGQYAAFLFVMTTLFGAASLQMKDVAKGRDPRPMNDWKFWVAAIAQGGSLGLLGDFVYSGLTGSNRFGGSIISSLAGPVASKAEGIVRLGYMPLADALDGGTSNYGRELTRVLKSITPGSSLWYARRAFEASAVDWFQRLVDPDFDAANRRIMQRAERDYGQGFWWEPGELTPARAPDFENIMGDN